MRKVVSLGMATAVSALVACGVNALIGIQPAAAAALFPECPAVGAVTGCNTLITYDGINITIQTDPSQGPYDGSDDNLIGFLNTSNTFVNSITLSGSGNGGGLFAFDGDGICESSFRTSACGTATGYEGPGVTFSNITTTVVFNDTGTVNFTGGLAPGLSRYFSLESAPQSGLITPGPISLVPEPSVIPGAILIGSLLSFAVFRKRSLQV